MKILSWKWREKDVKLAYARGTALVDNKTKRRYPHRQRQEKAGYSQRTLYGKILTTIANGEILISMHAWSGKREGMTMPSFETSQCLVPLKPRSRMTCEQSVLVLGRSASEIPTCGDEPLFLPCEGPRVRPPRVTRSLSSDIVTRQVASRELFIGLMISGQ